MIESPTYLDKRWKRFSFYFARGNGCLHGPQVWPWWRLFSLSFVLLENDRTKRNETIRLRYYTKTKSGFVDYKFRNYFVA